MRRIKLDLAGALIDALPELQPGAIRERFGRKLVNHKSRELAEIAWEAREPWRQHSHLRGAAWYSADELRSRIRCAKRAVPEHMGLLFDFPEGKRGYSPSKGYTKPYILKGRVGLAQEKILRGLSPAPIVDEKGERVTALPNNGVPDGLGLEVPAILGVSFEGANRALEEMRQLVRLHGADTPVKRWKKDGTTYGDALIELLKARRWIASLARAFGIEGIPNLYREQTNGRLVGVGFNVVPMRRLVRTLLLDGTGLVDYDLARAHFTILAALGGRLGVPVDLIEDYTEWRDTWHMRWTQVSGFRHTAAWKQVMASWLNGGTLTPTTKTRCGELVGPEAMRALSDDPRTRALYEQVRGAVEAVTEHHLKGTPEGAFENAVGARTLTRSRNRLANHVLCGFEQLAIRAMCREARGLKAVVFDGFIAEPQDVVVLEEAAQDALEGATGVRVALRVKAEPFDSEALVEESA